ncbi:hypothetical protein CKAH01_10417 [Colletotrichum kahawae]|uniref:Uncharacterized protein n=1 Tax=Colletotrichum kahawae TaxID=34407 RepID=A0AAE0CXE1_COLKA|nr:hypothetical protein CKAH01_10417 [Colletotrichum kahawae]
MWFVLDAGCRARALDAERNKQACRYTQDRKGGTLYTYKIVTGREYWSRVWNPKMGAFTTWTDRGIQVRRRHSSSLGALEGPQGSHSLR